jgi:hypothetical protein
MVVTEPLYFTARSTHFFFYFDLFWCFFFKTVFPENLFSFFFFSIKKDQIKKSNKALHIKPRA